MLPTIEEAERLLTEAESCNPGQWGNHSRIAARCAEKIAASCGELDSEKAYILGLLHDIGRRFGVGHLRHVWDGYTYMTALGYDEVARIYLTHSFNNHSTQEYIGNFDITDKESELLDAALGEIVYDDYDRLIQLCDALAGSEGVLDIEERMEDIRRRYGYYPRAKWDTNIKLKKYFEKKAGDDIYRIAANC